jgi:RNA polymerase sigma-70 factor, ECF subfamily
MDDSASDSAETQDLLQKASQGERKAFDRLLDRHRAALVDFVELRMDARLRARLDADDVVQDVQMEAVRRLPDYLNRRPMPFRHWLRKTAYQRLAVLRRKHVFAAGRAVDREVALPDRSSLVLAQQLFAAGPSPSQEMEREELVRRVRAALAQLSEVARDVLVMRNHEGMSYQEIGDILGIEPAAARKRHGRALISMHELLSETTSEDSQP